MTSPDIVSLFDVDNTLVDNDRIQDDLRKHLERESGRENRDRYWAIFEQLRSELGYADYLGALQSYRLAAMNDTRLSTPHSWWTTRLRTACTPGSLDAIERLGRWGLTVILSDGDRAR